MAWRKGGRASGGRGAGEEAGGGGGGRVRTLRCQRGMVAEALAVVAKAESVKEDMMCCVGYKGWEKRGRRAKRDRQRRMEWSCLGSWLGLESGFELVESAVKLTAVDSRSVAVMRLLSDRKQDRRKKKEFRGRRVKGSRLLRNTHSDLLIFSFLNPSRGNCLSTKRSLAAEGRGEKGRGL